MVFTNKIEVISKNQKIT